MPQGRRKTPFGGKAKKAQLQEKREKKQEKSQFGDDNRIPFTKGHDNEESDKSDKIVAKCDKDKSELLMDLPTSHLQSTAKSGGRRFETDASRYELRFNQESKNDLAIKREMARQKIEAAEQCNLELPIDQYFPKSLDFPIRPDWDTKMTSQKLEANEAKYFREYVQTIFNNHEQQKLSFFELNLETWRQLWRVLEKSDILLLVVDARYPAAMFPPSLYHYIISVKKHFVLVLNKIDLIPAGLALAWRDYFQKIFPQIHVTFFSSTPSYNLVKGGLLSADQGGLKFRRLRGTISMVVDGAKQIFDIVKGIIEKDQRKISVSNLESWESKIQSSATLKGKSLDAKTSSKGHPLIGHENDSENSENLTIGMLGQPNAGKSSLINSLIGKRVVSVSKTPGHTKHFQTIFITKFVVLCDCPGLVFPSLVPRELQVLLGSYPISQVREPMSIVKYIAERVDLPNLLKIEHPEQEVRAKNISILE